MQVKLRASINKNMLNSGEQHLQLPKKGLSAEQITGSLEKRVCYSQQQIPLLSLHMPDHILLSAWAMYSHTLPNLVQSTERGAVWCGYLKLPSKTVSPPCSMTHFVLSVTATVHTAVISPDAVLETPTNACRGSTMCRSRRAPAQCQGRCT